MTARSAPRYSTKRRARVFNAHSTQRRWRPRAASRPARPRAPVSSTPFRLHVHGTQAVVEHELLGLEHGSPSICFVERDYPHMAGGRIDRAACTTCISAGGAENGPCWVARWAIDGALQAGAIGPNGSRNDFLHAFFLSTGKFASPSSSTNCGGSTRRRIKSPEPLLLWCFCDAQGWQLRIRTVWACP